MDARPVPKIEEKFDGGQSAASIEGNGPGL
jgi:hypothetical protein